LGKTNRGGAPDARARAGHESNFILEIHLVISLC
jgi:hypothetical protein